jgi:hypothetical protein
MRDPRERTETTVAGAGQQSSEDSRQVLPLNHPGRRGFRVVAALAGVAAAVWAAISLGVTEPVGLVVIIAGVAAVLVSLPGGNLTAAATTALGGLILVLGLVQLSITDTPANTLDATVLNVCGFLLLGVVVGTCGLYEWETDEHGRINRRLRSTMTRDVRDTGLRRDPVLGDERVLGDKS